MINPFQRPDGWSDDYHSPHSESERPHLQGGSLQSSAPAASAFTPGPWGTFWNEENARLHLGSWRFTYEQTHALPLLRCSEGNARARANARLIAAAPDLLAACQRALLHAHLIKLAPERRHVIEVLKTAIARATGAAS